MTNSKLQAALDELERLLGTVRGFKKRTGKWPDTDSDAGRAWFSLQLFASELKKLDLAQIVDLPTR